MITQQQAIKQGYTVEHYTPHRPVAVKGPQTIPCFNRVEEALLSQLASICKAYWLGDIHPETIREAEALMGRLARD